MLARTAAQIVSTGLVAVMTLAAAPSFASSADVEGEQTTLRWINERRASKGRRSLSVDSQLSQAARRHAQRMIDNADIYHNRNLGNEVEGYSRLGENVAGGFSVESVNQSFWDSPGHRNNILVAEFTHYGVGYLWESGELYAVQVFGQRSSSKPSSADSSSEEKPAKKESKKSSGGEPSRNASTGSKQPSPEPSRSRAPRPEQRASTPPKEQQRRVAGDGQGSGDDAPTGGTKSDSTFLIDQRRPIMDA